MKRGFAATVVLFFIVLSHLFAHPPKDSTELSLYHQYFDDTLAGTSNRSLYSNVFGWLGTPYRYGGSSRKGIDCSGFVKKLYLHAYNIQLIGGSANIFAQVKEVEKDSLQEGDLLFFKTRGGRISHIGIYLKDHKFAHAATRRGIVIDDLNDVYYTQKFYSAGRHEAIRKQIGNRFIKRIPSIGPSHLTLLPHKVPLRGGN